MAIFAVLDSSPVASKTQEFDDEAEIREFSTLPIFEKVHVVVPTPPR